MESSFLNPLLHAVQKYPTQPKWLLGKNLRSVYQWKERANRRGYSFLNVVPLTLPSLVMEWSTGDGVSEPSVDRRQLELLLSQLVSQAISAGRLCYFHALNNVEAFAGLLLRTFEELRLAGETSDSLRADAFETPAKHADISLLLRDYETALLQRGWHDYAAHLGQAIRNFRESSRVSPYVLVEMSPQRFSRLEYEFLELIRQSAVERFSWEGKNSRSFEARLANAIGETNEVRAAFRQIFQDESRFDQWEILHSDYSVYVPAIYELLVQQLYDASPETLPVTFGEGIACVYSRPGRALRAWVRWCRGGFEQHELEKVIREGLLDLSFGEDGESDDTPGFAATADLLRQLPIGHGRQRWLTVIETELASLQERCDDLADTADDEENVLYQRLSARLRRYQPLHKLITALLELSPCPDAAAVEWLSKSRQFLSILARSGNQLDRYADQKLQSELAVIERSLMLNCAAATSENAMRWIEELPVEIRILASGPRPGCLHVDHWRKGGHSGRRKTILLGMDNGRFPPAAPQDPVVLDCERRELSVELLTSVERFDLGCQEFDQLLGRLEGEVCFSYSAKSLDGDRELFPCNVVLDLCRIQMGADLEESELIRGIGAPETFAVGNGQLPLSQLQWWLESLLNLEDETHRNRFLYTGFPNLLNGDHARRQKDSPGFTAWDGWVREAADQLHPTKLKLVSPSRLETYGQCGRKYLFRYGLGLYPPQDRNSEEYLWLDPLQKGNLLHQVFERFLFQLTERNLIPDRNRDATLLEETLQQAIEVSLAQVPVRIAEGFDRQVQELKHICRIFLQKEEEYCRTTGARPRVMEVSLGLGEPPRSAWDCTEPVPLELSDKRVLYLGGRIDRIDEIQRNGTRLYGIWDYKTGSSYSFSPNDPFQSGRKLQPYLYLGLLRHQLRTMEGETQAGFFGYFFPNTKEGGLRMQWTPSQLQSGDQILRLICDAIGNGVFVATSEKEDCRYCDYQSICSPVEVTALQSQAKLANSSNTSLAPLVALRSLNDSKGART